MILECAPKGCLRLIRRRVHHGSGGNRRLANSLATSAILNAVKRSLAFQLFLKLARQGRAGYYRSLASSGGPRPRRLTKRRRRREAAVPAGAMSLTGVPFNSLASRSSSVNIAVDGAFSTARPSYWSAQDLLRINPASCVAARDVGTGGAPSIYREKKIVAGFSSTADYKRTVQHRDLATTAR